MAFIIGMAFHSICVFIKLFPAALVSSRLRALLVSSSSRSCFLMTDGNVDEKMFQLQQHIFVSEQEMGYRILGVKITMKLSASLLTSFLTFLAAVIRFAQNI